MRCGDEQRHGILMETVEGNIKVIFQVVSRHIILVVIFGIIHHVPA